MFPFDDAIMRQSSDEGLEHLGKAYNISNWKAIHSMPSRASAY